MAGSRPEDVLEALRTMLETRRAEMTSRAERIRAAIDAYATALDQELAAELAERAGLTGFEAGSAATAAKALLDLVASLPELSVERATRSPEAPRAPTVAPEPAEAPAGHANAFVYEASAEARALLNEVHSIDLESMPGNLFRAYASELAARARSLQDRGHNAEDIPGRVIRKLTRFAYDRGVLVFGLKRSDKADWDEIARKHRVERDRMLAGEPKQLTHKLPLSKREEVSSPTATEDEAEDEGEDDDRVELPHLQQTTRDRPLVLVGGISKQDKLERLQSRYGIQAEWVETQRAGTHAISTLEQRVRDGRVAALVVLDGLLGHKHFEPIVDAARRARTPLAYGNKGGKASIAGALSEIEAQLSPAAGTA